MEGVATQILCQQCTAPLAVEPGANLVPCRFCGTTNHVDKSRAIMHYALQPTVRPDAAGAALRRWMAGNEAVKGLDELARLEEPVYQLFPMWLVRARQDGQEATFLQPAAATSISELKQLKLPAGSLESYGPEMDGVAVSPTVPHDMMMTWLTRDQGVAEADVSEVALVHIPLYTIAYRYQEARYLAAVDAATSEVFASVFPAKKELPYRLIAAVAFVANFLIAFLPLGGILASDMARFTQALTLYFIALSAVALLVFVMAAVVAARV